MIDGARLGDDQRDAAKHAAAKLRVNAFLATLATALSFGGIAVGVTNGGLLITPASSVFTFIGQHRVAGIQYPVIIFGVVAIVLQLVLAYTVFGRHLYGVGDKPQRGAAVGPQG
jgi:ribose transport system permease protein